MAVDGTLEKQYHIVGTSLRILKPSLDRDEWKFRFMKIPSTEIQGDHTSILFKGTVCVISTDL